MSSRNFFLTTEILLRAYRAGIFPMAESAESSDLRWFDPPLRGIIPLDHRFHVSSRLRRTIRHRDYAVRIDTDFDRVIQLCAEAAPDRPVTWINKEITKLFATLHRRGYAHSVEVWRGDMLIGGLYGVAIGSAFFGESMFSRARDGSKIALVHLVALLRHLGFTLLDTQFQTEHLARFGAYEETRANYHLLLDGAVKNPSRRFSLPLDIRWDQLVEEVLQPVTQTS